MWKDFFFFSQGEKNGLIILVSLILMMFAINFCIPNQSSHAETYLARADSLITQTKDSMILQTPHYSRKYDTTYQHSEKKTYKQNEGERQNIGKSNTTFHQPKKDYEALHIELNSADTTELKKLRGIGSKLSQRIVKYRTKLGRFSSKEQLKAVYGLSEETYEAILPYVWVDSTAIQ